MSTPTMSLAPAQRATIDREYGARADFEVLDQAPSGAVTVFAYWPNPNANALVIDPDGTITDSWEVAL